MNIKEELSIIINKCFVEPIFEPQNIDWDLKLIDIYPVDSISMIGFIVEIEKYFDFEFSEDELIDFYGFTFNEIINHIHQTHKID